MYLNVWNVGGPTIMVTRVTVSEKDSDKKGELEPQVVLESGKVAPIDIGYQLLYLVSSRCGDRNGLVNFPDGTVSEGHFTAHFFSLGIEHSVSIDRRFQFLVTEEHISTRIIDEGLRKEVPPNRETSGT
jgi:hypothetical protein